MHGQQNIKTSPLVFTFGKIYSIHNPISNFISVFEFVLKFKDETYKASFVAQLLSC